MNRKAPLTQVIFALFFRGWITYFLCKCLFVLLFPSLLVSVLGGARQKRADIPSYTTIIIFSLTKSDALLYFYLRQTELPGI